MSFAASFQPMYSNIITPERMTLPGLILSRFAYLGAVPCVASNTATPSPTLPPGASPSPPPPGARGRTGDVVAGEIRRRDDVVFVRAQEQLLEHRVGDAVLHDDAI